MKTKLLFLLLTCCLLILAAWLVDAPNPAQAIAGEVPEKYREPVQRGLEYLVRNQHKDGHWEGDGGKHPVAMTGLAGLALLMERKTRSERGVGGPTIREAKYPANIRKAVDWLMDQSQAKRDGLIFSEHSSETARYMEGHGLATLFLAGACEDEFDAKRKAKMTDVLTRAVKYIVKAQSSQGGWYHTSKAEGHDFAVISATAIQCQALQAVANAGIPVPEGALMDARAYFKMAMANYKPGQNRNRSADTAAALMCCFSPDTRFGRFLDAGEIAKDGERTLWFKYCQTEIPMGRKIQFGRDELSHYYYAQAVFNIDNGSWNDYRTALFDHLKSSQNKDGSWPAPKASPGDIGIGPIYTTALWCIVLQLDNQNHPSIGRAPVIVT